MPTMRRMSTVFAKLHRNRIECKERLKAIANHPTERMYCHGNHVSTYQISSIYPNGCGCALYYLARAIGLSGCMYLRDKEFIKKVYNLSEGEMDEVDFRYEGDKTFHAHTFADLAKWARSIGH